MKDTGTLEEIVAKPGDVVECVYGVANAGKGQRYTVNADCDILHFKSGQTSLSTFRIISRASDKPKLWRDMTPEEKGALLLAAHEWKVIENNSRGPWLETHSPIWADGIAYRIKSEPKIETVNMYYPDTLYGFNCSGRINGPTHRITFNLIDGIPDCSSVKMEKL